MEIKSTIWNLWQLESRVSQRLLKTLVGDKQLDRIQFLKCRLGVEVFVNNSFKLLIIYGLALLLGTEKSTLLLHSSFLGVRTFAYGAHAKSSSGCIMISSLLFLGIPLLFSSGFRVTKFMLFLLSIVSNLILLKYAPGSTKKNKIIGESKKRLLKRKACLNGLTISIFGLSMPLGAANLIVIGNLLASCCVLPHVINEK
jgi:accessory gene regulator B